MSCVSYEQEQSAQKSCTCTHTKSCTCTCVSYEEEDTCHVALKSHVLVHTQSHVRVLVCHMRRRMHAMCVI
jgi:hypothetical protein